MTAHRQPARLVPGNQLKLVSHLNNIPRDLMVRMKKAEEEGTEAAVIETEKTLLSPQKTRSFYFYIIKTWP